MLDKRNGIVSSVPLDSAVIRSVHPHTVTALTNGACRKQWFRPIRGQQHPPLQSTYSAGEQVTAETSIPGVKRSEESGATSDSDGIYLPSLATEKATRGDYAEARDLYDYWLKTGNDIDDYRIYFNRAICHYELEEYDRALSDVNVAIRLKEKWPKGHYVKGKILSEQKKFQEAEDSFLMSLKMDGYENPDTESRIRKNIFMALVNDGFDAALADRAASKQASYAQAKEYLQSGSIVLSLDMARSQKAANLSQLSRKVGRILPPVWFSAKSSLCSSRSY